MNLKKLVLTMILATGVSSGLWAQDTLRVSVEKAVEIALSDNPTIKVAEKEVERQLYVKRETRGKLLPSVSVSGSYNRAISKMEYDLGGGTKMSLEGDNTLTGVANLTVPLLAPSVYSILRMNDEQKNAAVEAARASKINLECEVRKGCYNVLLARESLTVLLASEKNIKEYLAETKVRYKQGLSSEYDLITAEVQLSTLQPNIVQAKNAISVANMMLKMYMSVPENVSVYVDGNLNDYRDVINNTNTGGYSREIANNTELKSIEFQGKILEYQYKSTRAGRMPTLAAVANYQAMGRTPMSAVSSNTFDWFMPFSAGLQLSIPIFAGNSKASSQKSVRNTIDQLKLNQEYLAQSIRIQVTNAINSIDVAREQLIMNAKSVEQSQKGYTIANTRYQAGLGTILELNNAELTLTQAQLRYSQSIFDYLSAEANYYKIIGEQQIEKTKK